MSTRRWLVTADELGGQLAGPASARPLVLDVRWNLAGPDGAAEYRAGHVPGARWVDLETELSAHGPRSRGGAGRHPLPRPDLFAAAMRAHGLSAGHPVVAMDGGQLLGASRLWWLLRDAGHDAVRVLDGGFPAWRSGGWAVAQGPDGDVDPGDFEAGPPRLPVLAAEGVAAAVRSGRQLVDLRAPARYRGEHEPVDPVAGHVPGAVNLPATLLLGPEGRLLPGPELQVVLADLAEDAVLYCGSGVTATQGVLALAEAGRGDVTLYPGSWSDWASDPARPVATGGLPGTVSPSEGRRT